MNMHDNNPYIDKASAELKKLRADYDRFVGEVDSEVADAKMAEDRKNLQANLEQAMSDAENKLTQLREGGEDALDDVKAGFETSMEKLRHGMRKIL